MNTPTDSPATIAYVASLFPNATETFVYREVVALRERGWTVHTVSLHDTPDWEDPRLGELAAHTTRVYGFGMPATLGNAAIELLAHPLATMRTFAMLLGDMLFPGEAMRAADRLKLPAQAVAGIGLARRLRSLGVRHVHCHFAHAPASVGMYAATQIGVTFSFTGHANDLFQRRSLLVRKLERASFVSCISRWHEAYYRSAAPRAKTNYRVIRCGVDIDDFKPRATQPTPAPAPLRFLTVCRLIEKKGVDTLIRGLHQMAGPHAADWHLTVAGDGPELQHLQNLARELGCEHRVQWLGLVNNPRVRELLAAADIFALPCRTDSSGDRDGIPVVLMEAMACGLPVISGDLPAIRELIEHNINGILVGNADATQAVARLAESLSYLATHPEDRSRLGQAARERVRNEFSLDANISLLEAALRESLMRRNILA